jgi:hypothetical protein
MIIRHVKDYKGALILRTKARKISGQWYEEGVTCILMPDNKWYRTTSNSKVIYDWKTKTYIFKANAINLREGLCDDGSFGYFQSSDKNVRIFLKKTTDAKCYCYDPLNTNSIPLITPIELNTWSTIIYYARTPEIALKYGYIESIHTGHFYKKDDIDSKDMVWFNKKTIPSSEKSNTYSILDDNFNLIRLKNKFKNSNLKIEPKIQKLNNLIKYSFGIELETSNGFVPLRIRDELGFTALRDGSLDGIEYTSVPFQGSKGLQAVKNFCKEISNRCDINEKCSLHIHFGDVRRDKLYILSLWNLMQNLQTEFAQYFPYSRSFTIRSDGKVYCKPLPNLNVNLNTILKSKNKNILNKEIYDQFNKIYSWLNNNVPLGEIYEKSLKKSLNFLNDSYKWKFIEENLAYTVKNSTHSIKGHKWDKPMRYHWVNFLCTFFSSANTIEFRIHEATLNYNKIFSYMLICNAILNYANNIKLNFSLKSISLKTVLEHEYEPKIVNYLLEYLNYRKNLFNTFALQTKTTWKSTETLWLNSDKDFLFNNKTILDVL